MLRSLARRAYRFKVVKALYACVLLLGNYLLYGLSFCVPRVKRKWVFGSYPRFQDNSKYLYLHILQHHQELHPIWICRSREDLAYFRERGLPAAYRGSWEGRYHCLTARVYCYSFYPTDINFFTSGGALLLNLWHGIGLKKVEFNDNISPRSRDYFKPGLLKYFQRPWIFRRPAFVLSTARFVSDYYLRGAFRVLPEQCLELGYPRCDLLFLAKDQVVAHIKRYEKVSTEGLLARMASYSRTLIYLPTFRDSGTSVLEAGGIDLEELNRILQTQNCLLLLKLHMNDRLPDSRPERLDNIILLESDTDIYPLLPFTDCLITDYSSVYYDYLLLGDKQVILFPFDLEQYHSTCRELHFPYSQAVRGRTVLCFKDLCEAIARLDNHVEGRQELRKRYWADYEGDSSARLVAFLKAQVALA